MADVLGKYTFSETPDVNGIDVLLDNGTTVSSVTGVSDQILVTGTATSPIVGIVPNAIMPGIESLTLPSGTTAERPLVPVSGMIRYNTTLGYNEKYTGAYWSPFGLLLQLVTGNIAISTGTTQLPWDNTTPAITEGHQIWTTSFTPVSATSKIIIQFSLIVGTTTAARIATTTTFFGTTIIGASSTYCATANQPFALTASYVYSPASTATVTLQSRSGLNGTGTLSINQVGANSLNGAAVTEYRIMEIE